MDDLLPVEEMLVHHGWQLRDADLETVEHYFVYNANLYAEALLG